MEPLTLTFAIRPALKVEKLALRYDSTAQQEVDEQATLSFPTDLHALAFYRAGGRKILAIERQPLVTANGWEDWSQSGPGELEAGAPLLPLPGFDEPLGEKTVYRYESVWVRNGEPTQERLALMREVGLRVGPKGLVPIWRAVKLVWKYSKYLKYTDDPRVIAAMWLVNKAWDQIEIQSVEQSARMAILEAQSRIGLELGAERRRRLESSTDFDKWLRYYSTLDKLIEINS